MAAPRRVAVVGAGWAGLAAAVRATERGHRVTVFEASHHLGGRARTAVAGTPDSAALDNGQHILIGAYRETLALLRTVGVDTDRSLLRLPMSLRFPDGSGLALPDWPAPIHLLAGVLTARGWTLGDKLSLLRTALRWRLAGFSCPASATVADLCGPLSPRVRAQLIDPLCVSALNLPMAQACGATFLRVLRDALFAGPGGSDFLLPRVPLGDLFPQPAAAWLQARGVELRPGRRVMQVGRAADGPAGPPTAPAWLVDGEAFDHVVLACPSHEAARLARMVGASGWADRAQALEFTAIATVYVSAARHRRLPGPVVALPVDGLGVTPGPVQFAFDHGQLSGRPGELALVASAAQGDRDQLQQQALTQARAALGWSELQVRQTFMDKRATFACAPGLVRPGSSIAPGLWASADYVAGPYPATLEGAVRCAGEVIDALSAR